VGGSIGIEHYLSQLSAMDSFNDFERVPLPDLDPPRAMDLLGMLLEHRGINLARGTRNEALALIGTPIPYFIQVFVAEIANELTVRPGPVGMKRLNEIYQHRVLGAACKAYFQYYFDRLMHYPKTEEKAAKAMLKEMAIAYPQPVRREHLMAAFRREAARESTDEGFARLLGDLGNDFYVSYHAEVEGCTFASKVLADWWRRYYAF
jgi:hypothetical protein